MKTISTLALTTLKGILRDRVLYAIGGAGLLIFLLVPLVSIFSMRQVQELTIALAMTVTPLMLLIFALLLGTSSIWRDIEKRYTASVLGLPISRRDYVLGKFTGISLFLGLCTVFLTAATIGTILIAMNAHPSDLPVKWGNVLIAMGLDSLKYILLAAIAVMFSSLGTSFFLPIFGTLALFFAGGAAQPVMDYVNSPLGQNLSGTLKVIVKFFYYILPNFSVFDTKAQAIYGLPLTWGTVGGAVLYFAVYCGILLTLATHFFKRRELP